MRPIYTDVKWDGQITICVDARRVRYCAKQLIGMTRVGSDPHTYASQILAYMDRGHMPLRRKRYTLEKLFRQNVYGQRTSL